MQNTASIPHWQSACWSLSLLILVVTFGDVLIQEMHGTAAFYAALAREMLDRGDFLAPFQGAQAYLLKPPLALWLSAMAAALFGINDFAMTLPSRLGGLGCVALTYLLARRYFGPAAAWFAALIVVTNGIYIQFTTNFRMDSLMTLGALLILWGYLNLQRNRGAAALCGGIALSALTKGPLIFVMLLIFIPHAAAVGQWRAPARSLRYWALLLILPAAWYGYLWLAHGAALTAQLNYDFWRGDTAIGLSAIDSAMLEYLIKPLRRLWPWLPLMVLALMYGFAICCSRRPVAKRADIALLLGLFILNYGIAAIKPDPDVRYLYPSLPLIAILCGGLLSRWTHETLPRWIVNTGHGLLALAVIYAGVLSYRGAADQQGLRAMQALVAQAPITSSNSVVIVDTLPPLDAPRRNDPMPDSVYYYFGLTPLKVIQPVTLEALPAAVRYVFVRRKRLYEQTLQALGLRAVARSTKIALFERP